MAILTKKQKEVLDYILQYKQEYGYAPALNEIKIALGASAISTIHEHVSNLVKKGFINRIKGSARGLELLKLKLTATMSVPLLGSIACGEPLEAIEDSYETVAVVDDPRFNFKDLYALRAKGDSMLGDGIFSGDYLIVRKQSAANNGDTVVAIIDDNEATLKRFYREEGRIRLQPANDSYKPIYRRHVEIRGVVVKVIRDLIAV